jgi:ATP synthase protein I
MHSGVKFSGHNILASKDLRYIFLKILDFFCLVCIIIRFELMQDIKIEMENKDKYYSYLRQAGIYTVIPIILAVGPIIGYFMGNFLDKKLHTAPYLMILFILFGFIASGKEVYNLAKRAMQEMDEEDKKNN